MTPASTPSDRPPPPDSPTPERAARQRGRLKHRPAALIQKPGMYFSMAKIARVTGWSTESAREVLQKHGALVKRAGRHYTTRSLLRRAFPEEYDELLANLTAGDTD